MAIFFSGDVLDLDCLGERGVQVVLASRPFVCVGSDGEVLRRLVFANLRCTRTIVPSTVQQGKNIAFRKFRKEKKMKTSFVKFLTETRDAVERKREAKKNTSKKKYTKY